MHTMTIPDKLYFKIGEVSKIAGVEPYVLRYWETEFNQITPVKSRTNQRLYKKTDVELILKIKELLYQERFTIHGAKKRLKEEHKNKRQEREEQHPQLGLTFAAVDAVTPDPNYKSEVLQSLKGLLSEMQQLTK